MFPQKIKRLSNRDLPIGVFDSGLGGLTVVNEILKKLPKEDIIYFGDLARLPYGIKSKRQITEFSIENTEFLLRLGVKTVVIACNSSASAGGALLRNRYDVPILDVIRPAAEAALQKSKNRKIGVIGTQATIASGAYEQALKRLSPNATVNVQACPLFVPLVEEGILNGTIARALIQRYIAPLMKKRIDTLILGCTHYPILKEAIQKFVGARVKLIDSAGPTVEHLESKLRESGLIKENGKKGKLKVFVSDLPQSFVKIGERFLGMSLRNIQVVRLQETATIKRKWFAR